MSRLVVDLATAFDDDLKELQDEIDQAKAMERDMRNEIDNLRAKLQRGDDSGQRLDEDLKLALEEEAETSGRLHAVVERSQARGLASLVKDETAKQATRDDAGEDAEDEAVRAELVEQLDAAIEARKVQVEALVAVFADAGAGEKMADYRRLISLSTGVAIHAVDDMLGAIEDELVAGDRDDVVAMDGIRLEHDGGLLHGLFKNSRGNDHDGDIAMAG